MGMVWGQTKFGLYAAQGAADSSGARFGGYIGGQGEEETICGGGGTDVPGGTAPIANQCDQSAHYGLHIPDKAFPALERMESDSMKSAVNSQGQQHWDRKHFRLSMSLRVTSIRDTPNSEHSEEKGDILEDLFWDMFLDNDRDFLLLVNFYRRVAQKKREDIHQDSGSMRFPEKDQFCNRIC